MKKVVASAMILNSRGHVLLAMQKKSGLFCPPGGKVEDNEYIVDGLIREVKEEIGILVTHTELVGFQDQQDKVIFFYLIKSWVGEIKNLEPEKHGDWKWYKQLPDDRELVEGVRYFKRELWERMYESWAA